MSADQVRRWPNGVASAGSAGRGGPASRPGPTTPRLPGRLSSVVDAGDAVDAEGEVWAAEGRRSLESGRLGLPIGWVVNIVGALVLLLWLPLRQRPGYGTIANVIVVGLVADAALAVLPQPEHLAIRSVLLGAGIVLNGVATGLYVGARLGPGPRDGLMTGLAARGHSLRLVRTAIELAVVAIGWLLGGTVGVGTVLFALAIGPLVHYFIPTLTVAPRVGVTTLSPGRGARPRSRHRHRPKERPSDAQPGPHHEDAGMNTELWTLFGATGRGVLVTLKRDGRPQLSNVDYVADSGARTIRLSTTDGRAKVRNLRRDPRVSFYVTTTGGGAYAVAEGNAELSPPAVAPDDATVEELIEVYRGVNGEHPDWDEYRAVMVSDQRLVVRLHVDRLYGWLPARAAEGPS